jgi:hypothetical protein
MLVHISLYRLEVKLLIIKLTVDVRIVQFLCFRLMIDVLRILMRGHHVVVVDHQVLL